MYGITIGSNLSLSGRGSVEKYNLFKQLMPRHVAMRLVFGCRCSRRELDHGRRRAIAALDAAVHVA